MPNAQQPTAPPIAEAIAEREKERFLPVIIAVLFGTMLSCSAYFLIAGMEKVEVQKTFERAAQHYIDGLRARVNEALLLDPANEFISSDDEFLALVEKQKSLIPIEGISSQFLNENELQQYADAAKAKGLLTYEDIVSIGAGHWGFLATPKPHYYEPSRWLALGALLGGLVTTGLISGYLYFMLRQSARDHAVMVEQNRLRLQLELTIVEMRQAQMDALHAKEVAENANRAKSDFLATMSHEIRTPMNGVLGMTELLLETPLSHKQYHYATTTMESAEGLLGIINDILDFSKIEAGKLDMEIVPIDLRQVVEGAAELLGVRAREKGLEIVVQYLPGTPRFLKGDAVRIRQVISNLLGNAIKFTEKGHIIVTVESTVCMLAERPDSQSVKISVTDTGIGIAPEVQERIFEKFMQADNSTTRRFGGTGLGLAIAKQLADLMGGDIGVESDVTRGSTFWFTMILPTSDQLENPLAEFGASPDILRGVRVLVVDDLPIHNIIMKEHLTYVGMKVDTCTNAADALEMLRAASAKGVPYHLGMIDYLMPQVNGEELVRMIKADGTIGDIALIMLTSADGHHHLERFERAGFSSLLSKPLRVQPLIDTIATVWEMYKNGHKAGLIADDSFARRTQVESADPNFQNAQILLAEDDRINQEFAHEILTSFHCEVTIARNGEEAVRLATDQIFDLILMDCQMPQMDGFEASRQLAELKRNKQLPNIPIIALTANALKGDRERCLQAGMVDYATKPLRKEHLAKILYKWLPSRFIPKLQVEASVAGLIVLVAEDNRINMEFAVEILEGMGCQVIRARNGVECLAEAQKEQPYDIVLMDVQMPEMDGLQATRELRVLQKMGAIPKVPIVAVTANAMKGDREICLDAGMDDYLTKPLQANQFKNILLEWVAPERLATIAQAQQRAALGNVLMNDDIIGEAKAVLGREFGTITRLFINNTEFMLDAIERCIRQARDPQAILMHTHSLHSSSGYMGATHLSVLAAVMERSAREASESHGDITKLWPLYEEIKFIWENTREQFEAHATPAE